MCEIPVEIQVKMLGYNWIYKSEVFGDRAEDVDFRVISLWMVFQTMELDEVIPEKNI